MKTLAAVLLALTLSSSAASACLRCSPSGWCEGGWEFGYTMCWQECERGYICHCSHAGEFCGMGEEFAVAGLPKPEQFSKAETLIKMQNCRNTPGCSYWIGDKKFGYGVPSAVTWGAIKAIYR